MEKNITKVRPYWGGIGVALWWQGPVGDLQISALIRSSIRP